METVKRRKHVLYIRIKVCLLPPHEDEIQFWVPRAADFPQVGEPCIQKAAAGLEPVLRYGALLAKSLAGKPRIDWPGIAQHIWDGRWKEWREET